jgi:hypothetical protein
MLNVVTLNVVILSVDMLIVVAPLEISHSLKIIIVYGIGL